MDIMELGAIGELVGGVAVVASLLYVGLQVRQSNIIEKAETSRAATSDYVATLHQMDAALFRRALVDFQGLSKDDQMRFHNWLIAFYWIGENEFTLSRRDLADKEHAGAAMRIMASMIRTPGVGYWWQAAGMWAFEPSFSGYLNDLASQQSEYPPAHEAMPWIKPDDPSSLEA